MFAWRLDAYTHHAMLFAQGGVKGDMSTLDDRVVSLLGEIRNIVGADNFSSSRTSNAPETALATHFRKILVALRSMKIDVGGDKPLRARAVFGKPVVELYPNVRASYLALVGNPMDLGTMDKRYRHYESVDAFLSDLKLIRDNAYTFNGNYHEVSRAAAEILAQGERMCMDIPESVRTRVPKVPTSNSKRFKPLRSLGDAAMLLLDGYASNALTMHMQALIMNRILPQKQYPKDSEPLAAVTTFLSLAGRARDIVAQSINMERGAKGGDLAVSPFGPTMNPTGASLSLSTHSLCLWVCFANVSLLHAARTCRASDFVQTEAGP